MSSAAKNIQRLLGDHQDSVVSRTHLAQQADVAHAAGEDTFTYGLLYQREAESRATVPRRTRFGAQDTGQGGEEGARRRTSWPVSRILLWRPSIWTHRRRVPRAAYPQARASNPRTPAQPRSSSRPLGLASGGVYRAIPVTRNAGALLPHRFTLTTANGGGLFSVALSRESPRIAVSNHPALRSPDFPRVVSLPPAAARPTRPQ